MSDDEPKRESRISRSHETYYEDHWKIVDVEDVDKVFATTTGNEIRIDFDGYGAGSGSKKVDENINVSAFLHRPEAEQLLEHLQEALSD